MANFGINGFGRIGRNVLRAMSQDQVAQVRAINDLTDTHTLAHLLKWDSVHGKFDGEIGYDNENIIVRGHKIRVLKERDLVAMEACLSLSLSLPPPPPPPPMALRHGNIFAFFAITGLFADSAVRFHRLKLSHHKRSNRLREDGVTVVRESKANRLPAKRRQAFSQRNLRAGCKPFRLIVRALR